MAQSQNNKSKESLDKGKKLKEYSPKELKEMSLEQQANLFSQQIVENLKTVK